MSNRLFATGAVILFAAAATACTTSPAEYAATLSTRDPKWRSPQCREMRMAASNYEAESKKTISLQTGLLLGPYGLGIALAGKEHQEKKRKLFAREMHLRCSSQPVPKSLEITTP